MMPRSTICFLVLVAVIAFLFSGCTRILVSGNCVVTKSSAGTAVQCADGGRVIVE